MKGRESGVEGILRTTMCLNNMVTELGTATCKQLLMLHQSD